MANGRMPSTAPLRTHFICWRKMESSTPRCRQATTAAPSRYTPTRKAIQKRSSAQRSFANGVATCISPVPSAKVTPISNTAGK